MRSVASALQAPHWALVVLLLGGLTLLFYLEIALPSRILAEYDIWTYFYPLRAYAAQAVLEARFPLWNPNTFLGAPFFANPQTALLYPGSVLFYLLPVPYAYSLSVILHVLLMALLTYVFLRKVFEVHTVGATVGAAAFAYGGFASAQVGHVNQLSATAWLPAVALLADLAVRRRSLQWAAAGAAALAVQLLAGHAQESYMTLWVALVVVGWRLLSSGTALARGLPHLLVLCGLGFGLAAVQLLPTMELSAQSIRGGGLSYEEGSSFSLPPPLLVRSLLPGYWYNLFSEYIGYIGGVAIGFAIMSLVFGPGKPTACAAALAALGLFFAVGAANPLYPILFEAVPGLDLFRVPARWLCVYSFGAAGLAALGVDWALRRQHSGPNANNAGSVTSLPPRHARRKAGLIKAGRAMAVGLMVVLLVWLALPSMAAVPGRIVALWAVALFTASLLALLALRWPGRLVALAIVVAVVAELRAAGLDLPTRHAVPAEAVEGPGQVAAYLRAGGREGRILSIAPTEYESQADTAIAARYPELGLAAAFNLQSALKLDEVMSPNVPLRYGLSTVDGYDGGVLPLRRFLDLASLLVPPSELRTDGVLRTRLIAIPEERFLRLMGVRAVIANQVIDPELDGVRYDVATARTLEPGQSLQVELPRAMRVEAVGLLGSVLNLPPAATPQGHLILVRSDGTREAVHLRMGAEIFEEQRPGPANARQPTAGPSREGRYDTAVRIAIPPGEPVTALLWEWPGPGAWTIRAVSLVAAGGTAESLLLQPSLRRTLFPVLKVYEREPRAPDGGIGSRPTRLLPRAVAGDDRGALAFLRSSVVHEMDDVLFLAAETIPADDPSPRSGGPAATDARFERIPGTPERLAYRRLAGEGSGYLVVDDAWFPGWRAQVDGRDVPVYRANVAFKAVWVPDGAWTVVLTYDPESLRYGAAISALALAISATLLIRGRIL